MLSPLKVTEAVVRLVEITSTLSILWPPPGLFVVISMSYVLVAELQPYTVIYVVWLTVAVYDIASLFDVPVDEVNHP